MNEKQTKGRKKSQKPVKWISEPNTKRGNLPTQSEILPAIMADVALEAPKIPIKY